VKVDSSTNSSLTPLNNGVQRGQQGDPAAAGTNAARTSASAPVASSGGAAADVSLSALASHLQNVAASGSADIDTAHVESIKQAIRDGSLKIDSSKIADGVLETARGLLQGTQPSGS
jgi:negative regulator of flagellin synthesis FlgM